MLPPGVDRILATVQVLRPILRMIVQEESRSGLDVEVEDVIHHEIAHPSQDPGAGPSEILALDPKTDRIALG